MFFSGTGYCPNSEPTVLGVAQAGSLPSSNQSQVKSVSVSWEK
jgi:hypothetical protein